MPTDRVTARPNKPDSPCAYCRECAVGTPAADELVCGCETDCGVPRCGNGARVLARPTIQTTKEQVPSRDITHPFGLPLTDNEQDRIRRWNPHPQAVHLARTLLAAAPDADMAVLPMYQPGKTYGFWRSGQPVHTVHGVVLLARNSFDTTGQIPEYPWARDMAARIAADRLLSYAAEHPEIRNSGGGTGTVAWATVHADGPRAGVFEDIIAPEEHMNRPQARIRAMGTTPDRATLAELSTALADVTTAWDSHDSVDTELGAEVQALAERLYAVLIALILQPEVNEALREEMRATCRSLSTAIVHYAQLAEHDTDASVDIYETLAPALALADRAITGTHTRRGHAASSADVVD